MKTRIVFLFGGMVFLSACSATSSLLSLDDVPEPVAVVAVEPIVATPDTWCQQIAASTRLRAQSSGFDAATLDRMTLNSFQQCQMLQAQ